MLISSATTHCPPSSRSPAQRTTAPKSASSPSSSPLGMLRAAESSIPPSAEPLLSVGFRVNSKLKSVCHPPGTDTVGSAVQVQRPAHSLWHINPPSSAPRPGQPLMSSQVKAYGTGAKINPEVLLKRQPGSLRFSSPLPDVICRAQRWHLRRIKNETKQQPQSPHRSAWGAG